LVVGYIARGGANSDPVIDRDLKKACGIVSVTVPPPLLTQFDVGIVGLYTLQYETYDERPVYQQYSWLCNQKAVLASGAKTADDEKISCKVPPKGATPNHFFYDDAKKFWKLAPDLGDSDTALIAPSHTSDSPDEVTSIEGSNWEIGMNVGNGQKKFKPASGVVVKCADKKHKKAAKGSTVPFLLQHDLAVNSASTCIGWRETAGCDPDGPQQKEQDKDCATVISAKYSGYCECKDGRQHRVACGHNEFKCEDACKVSFPAVVGQSSERTWTNQLARNLVLPGSTADWLTSQTKEQWIAFDLGVVSLLKVRIL
jgi:hypothetical protein